MSDKKLSGWRCPRCHKQRAAGEYHWHKDTETYVPAEKVEVIPVEQAERLEAERDLWKRESGAAAGRQIAAEDARDELEAQHEAFKERLTSEATIRDADLAGWNASRDLPIPDEGSTEPITKAVVEAAIKAAEEQV